jgi:hypothetical protein
MMTFNKGDLVTLKPTVSLSELRRHAVQLKHGKTAIFNSYYDESHTKVLVYNPITSHKVTLVPTHMLINLSQYPQW